MEYKSVGVIKPNFDYENQILTFNIQMEGIINQAVKEQIDFKDECVKKALVALGWTPPPSSHNKVYQADAQISGADF